MEVKEGQEIKEPEAVTEPATTEEPTPPTAEAQLATLQEEHKEVQRKYEETSRALKGTNESLRESTRKLKLRDVSEARMDGIEGSIQILTGLVSKSGVIEPEQAESYKQEFAALKERQEQQATQAVLEDEQQVNLEANLAVYRRAEAVYSDNTESLFRIRQYLLAGSRDLAEKEISKKENPVETKPAEETTEQIEVRLRKTIEKELRNEEGSNLTETGMPTGGTMGDNDFLLAFSEGKLDMSKSNVERAKKLTGT